MLLSYRISSIAYVYRLALANTEIMIIRVTKYS